jgi:hypothetical protein
MVGPQIAKPSPPRPVTAGVSGPPTWWVSIVGLTSMPLAKKRCACNVEFDPGVHSSQPAVVRLGCPLGQTLGRREVAQWGEPVRRASSSADVNLGHHVSGSLFVTSDYQYASASGRQRHRGGPPIPLVAPVTSAILPFSSVRAFSPL